MLSLNISTRRFYVGVQGARLFSHRLVNAAQTTQLLQTHFRVKGVIHYERTGGANPKDLCYSFRSKVISLYDQFRPSKIRGHYETLNDLKYL